MFKTIIQLGWLKKLTLRKSAKSALVKEKKELPKKQETNTIERKVNIVDKAAKNKIPMVEKITKDSVETAVKLKNYVWFDSAKDYDVNIVFIRNSDTKKSVTNVFDDFGTLSYKINGQWYFHVWPVTTDPGTKAVKEFHNPKGVARLVPGQYRGSHIIRLHAGKYEALGQDRPVKVYRDKNKDMTFDEVEIEEGIFGINIHRSNPTTESQYVENWSEGCMVFKRIKDFNEFMEKCRKARDTHGNRFTLTLIESKDIV